MADFEVQDITDDQNNIEQFLDQWADDIETFFPDFDRFGLTFVSTLAVIVDGEITGLFMYQSKGKEVHIELDYLCESHREKGIGADIFEQMKKSLRKEGYDLVVALQYNEQHGNYLKSLGFKPSYRVKNRFEILLS